MRVSDQFSTYPCVQQRAILEVEISRVASLRQHLSLLVGNEEGHKIRMDTVKKTGAGSLGIGGGADHSSTCKRSPDVEHLRRVSR